MAEPFVIFVGTYTGGRSEGVYSLRMDPSTGELCDLRLAARAENPSFLAASRSGRFVYAAGETAGLAGAESGSVSSYSVGADGRELDLLSRRASRGAGPCHVSLDASERAALVANYVGGSARVIPVGPDGLLGEGGVAIVHSDPSARAAHVHSLNVDPSGRFVLAADLGLDKVFIYRLDATAARLAPADQPCLQLSAGAGPRHLAFHPGGSFAFVINELNSTVAVCSWDAERGRLAEVQTVSTLPDEFAGDNAPAEVRVHPSGRFLYASNRGHDSIAAFEIDPDSGRLAPIAHFASGGKTPRHFAIAPGGEFLVPANQDSDNLAVFEIDGRTGALSCPVSVAEVPCPVCVLFLP
jgi:6-phosphogluconolactonase